MSELSLGHPQNAVIGKRWLASYPPGVPSEIPVSTNASLVDLLEKSCVQFADRKAFSSMGKSLTYRELDAETRAVAAWLQSRGLEKGDRVAVMMPNILQNPVAVYGILRAGMVVVNVNPLYTPRELEHQLKDSGAKALFVLENFAHVAQQAVPKTAVRHVVVAAMGDLLGLKGHIVNLVVRKVKKLVPAYTIPGSISFKAMLKEGQGFSLKPVSLTAQDIAFLQYTGGTTGVSKGAVLTHANLLANKLQISLWLDAAFNGQKDRPEVLNFICALPLCHIFALTVNSLMGIALGGHNLLIANPRDIPGFVKELSHYQPHIFPGINTLFNALMNNEDFRKLDLSRRRHGGAKACRGTLAFHRRLPHCGGLRPLRDIAGCHRQPPRFHGVQRNHRPADLFHRNRYSRRGRQQPAHRRGRRNLHPWAAGDGGLLAAAGRDGKGDDIRRLLPFRRHGLHG